MNASPYRRSLRPPRPAPRVLHRQQGETTPQKGRYHIPTSTVAGDLISPPCSVTLPWGARCLGKGFDLCGLRFSWTFIIRIVSGAGDVACATLNHLLMVRKAREADLPPWLIGRMMFNNAVSVIGGLVPVVGDVVVAAYKANSRNAMLLEGLSISSCRWRRTRQGVAEPSRVPVVCRKGTWSRSSQGQVWRLGEALLRSFRRKGRSRQRNPVVTAENSSKTLHLIRSIAWRQGLRGLDWTLFCRWYGIQIRDQDICSYSHCMNELHVFQLAETC